MKVSPERATETRLELLGELVRRVAPASESENRPGVPMSLNQTSQNGAAHNTRFVRAAKLYRRPTWVEGGGVAKAKLKVLAVRSSERANINFS